MRGQAPLDKCFSCAPFSVFPSQLIADIKRGVLENEKLIRLYFISPFIVCFIMFFCVFFFAFNLCFVLFRFFFCLVWVLFVMFFFCCFACLVLFLFCFVLFCLICLGFWFFVCFFSTVTVVFLHRHHADWNNVQPCQLDLLWNLWNR